SSPPPDMPVGLCEWCGYDREGLDSDGVCPSCRPLADEWRRGREALLDRYRCRPGDPSVLPMSWDEAVARVAGKLGHPVEVAADDGCEAPTWWFVPCGWIGCAGF